MTLDLTSLRKAVDSLARALNVATSSEKMKMLDVDQQDAIKAGVIQNLNLLMNCAGSL